AFFKALLFLAAGSVIHSLHHEQDIWKMGGLKSRMSLTFWTMLAGTLALAGVPPFSGFYSKDAILAIAFHSNAPLFVLALLVSLLTTFYMFRLLLVAFGGRARSSAAEHAHESPPVMTVPLLLLVVPAVLSGFWGIDSLYARQLSSGEAITGSSWIHQVFAP